MDATPVTLGQEFGGYATAVEHGIERLQGGAAPGRRAAARRDGGRDRHQRAEAASPGASSPRLAAELGLPLTEARDHFEAQGGRDALVEASRGAAHDRRVALQDAPTTCAGWAAGPGRGLAEIRLPDLQPGTSIMPGKVNPVVPEAVCRSWPRSSATTPPSPSAASAGNFELNVMLPVIARNLLESIRLLAAVSRALADKCVAGIEADVERCRTYALSSPAIGTALNPYIGYEEAAKVVKESIADGQGPAHRRARAGPAVRGGGRPGARRRWP